MELISAMEGDSPPAVAAARLDDLHFKDDERSESFKIFLGWITSWLNIPELTMFDMHRKSLIASEASYVNILSGQKLIKNAKIVHFSKVLKT